jgi:hypothetical protein
MGRPIMGRPTEALALGETAFIAHDKFLDEITLGPRAALASLTAEALDALGRIEEARRGGLTRLEKPPSS